MRLWILLLALDGCLAGWRLRRLAGGLIVIFYRQIAENLANGVSSYEKVKLFGVITVIVGLLVTMNLHVFILTLITNLMFGK